MNIENFLKKNPEDQRYASSFRRSAAAGIDIGIVLFLRIFTMQLLGALWMNKVIINFLAEFNAHFGTESIKNTPEHIDFVMHHPIFIYAIIFYSVVILIGTFYHAFLNSSAWQATIGKRIMNICMTTQNDLKITFNRGIMHYFLSVLPFAFLLYLMSYQLKNNLNFYQTITASDANLFFGVIFVIWVQIHLFTRKKTTAYDLICNTILVNGRTEAKWPWSKN